MLRDGHPARRLRHARFAVLCTVLVCTVVSARAQSPNYSYLYRVSNFVTYVPGYGGTDTTHDRYFTSTGFEGTTYTMDTSNISQFADGRLRWGSLTSPLGDFGWNDLVPADLGGSNNSAWDPDRPDAGTPYADEPGYARMRDIFDLGIVNRILDGENNVSNAYVDLYFGSGAWVQSDGVATTPELVLLERGGNSAVYVRAIKEGGSYSNALSVNMRTGTGTTYDPRTGLNIARVGGSAGFSVNTLEINSAQSVSGTGIDLMAFGDITTSDRIVGYQIWFEYNNAFCDGPDLHGFILSKVATPEAPSGVGLLVLLTAGGGWTWFARRRA